ncbi:uncharacterized protein KNAG_0D04250 [Huiozyma naganishii CBS 8797]|uniref:BED-type domain-containing protein n=1 Tax=Huiozyma naganishii (strain ATCC MYA-139 / BCRC 22969 / CBS 8797 / KCTC 17520 / NBRC 10181 / NCYC 3082 / Yp74L-3) TaxID=1071383 RepID=J7S784_HUIN7|nr:hypothetical protein KNAG_0D04250 [Kazachstania naganishii CBS 8797]CCK70171.1 hypothetical protein KNAG_0D04250 [Kazachstania naganishii CBS 8797]
MHSYSFTESGSCNFGNESSGHLNLPERARSSISWNLRRKVGRKTVSKCNDRSPKSPSSSRYDSGNKQHWKSEVLFEDGQKWIPIQLFKKYTIPCWTYFLTTDPNLTFSKCKYCGFVIKRSLSWSVLKRLQTHLRNSHRNDATVSYYHKFNGTSIADLSVPTSKITQPRCRYRNFTIETRKIDKLITDDIEELCYMENENAPDLVKSESIISILFASQNIPSSVVDNPAFVSLLKRIPKCWPMTPIQVRSIALKLSEKFEHMMERCIFDFSPIELEPTYLHPKNSNLLATVKKTLEANLLLLYKTPIISLSCQVWNDRYSVLSAQFFDHINNTQKTLPLELRLLREHKPNPGTKQRPEIADFVIENILRLKSPVISLITPNYTLSRSIKLSPKLHLDDTHSMLDIRTCSLQDLLTLLSGIFGYQNSFGSSASQKGRKGDNIIDSLIDLSQIDISPSIFGKINAFFMCMRRDTFQTELFETLCKKHGYTNSGCIIFDSRYPSSATRFLKNFLDLQPVVMAMNPYLPNEKFTEMDMKLARTILSLLSPIFKIISKFTSPDPTSVVWLYVFVCGLEKTLYGITEEMAYNRFCGAFKVLLTATTKYKETLKTSPNTIIASFLCPQFLLNNNLLKELYGTDKTTQYLPQVAKSILHLLNHLLGTKGRRADEVKNRQSGKTTLEDPLMEGLPFKGTTKLSVGLQDENIEMPFFELLDEVLLEEIENDLEHFLFNAKQNCPNIYEAYFKTFKFERTKAGFRKVCDERVLNPLEELLEIHIPVGKDFLNMYLSGDVGLLFTVITKLIFSESAFSKRGEYAFLSTTEKAQQEQSLERSLKIKLLNEQFALNKVDLEKATLATLCNISRQ